MKRNLQEKFLHEHLKIIASDNENPKAVYKLKYIHIVDLLSMFYEIMDYKKNNFDKGKRSHDWKLNIIEQNQLKQHIEKHFRQYFNTKVLNPYQEVILNLHDVNYLFRVMFFSASLNIVVEKSYDSQCYVFSENVTRALLEVGDLTSKCPCYFDAKDVGEEKADYFFYNNFNSKVFTELHAYTFRGYLGVNDKPIKCYTLLVRFKNAKDYGMIFALLDWAKTGRADNIELSGCLNFNNNIISEELVDNEVERLVQLVYASEIFIRDKPDLIQKKINEFSSKKSKREYELKHYSESTYNFVDMPYTHVKAYSDKQFRQPSYIATRWVGKGRKIPELKIIKGSLKSWKNQLKTKK